MNNNICSTCRSRFENVMRAFEGKDEKLLAYHCEKRDKNKHSLPCYNLFQMWLAERRNPCEWNKKYKDGCLSSEQLVMKCEHNERRNEDKIRQMATQAVPTSPS